MSKQQLVAAGRREDSAAEVHQYVSCRLGDQLFGFSVLTVQDVIRFQPVAQIPLAPPVIAGSINVRGRIVTVIDMRERLSMSSFTQREKAMMVVVEHQHELFALMVDAVGDVLSPAADAMEKAPANMPAAWKPMTHGVFKLNDSLLIILDVAGILEPLAKGKTA